MTSKHSYEVVAGRGLGCQNFHAFYLEATVLVTFGEQPQQLCSDCAFGLRFMGIALSQLLLQGSEHELDVAGVLREVDAVLGLPVMLESTSWPVSGPGMAELTGKVDCCAQHSADASFWKWSVAGSHEQDTCSVCASSTADFTAVRGTSEDSVIPANSPSWDCTDTRLGCCRPCALEIVAHLQEAKKLLIRAEAIEKMLSEIQEELDWESACMAKFGFIVIRDS